MQKAYQVSNKTSGKITKEQVKCYECRKNKNKELFKRNKKYFKRCNGCFDKIKCSVEGCGSSAQGKTDKCKRHGGGKRCSVEGCDISAQGKTDKCIGHGGGKRCSVEGCGISAQGKTDKCIGHGGGKRCPNCIDWIDSRCGSNKYDGYCASCFKRLFPDDERSKKSYNKTWETLVRDFINENFKGFIHDKPLWTHNCNCTHRRRIDHRKLIGNTILAVETDENKHSSYDDKDEEIRYDDVYMIHSGKWIFIRFNPNSSYEVNGKKYNIDIEDRLEILKEEIEKQIERIEDEDNEDLVEIIKLFY